MKVNDILNTIILYDEETKFSICEEEGDGYKDLFIGFIDDVSVELRNENVDMFEVKDNEVIIYIK